MSNLIKTSPNRLLTDRQFQDLADLPPELEWFANIANPKTRAAYKNDIQDFSRFVGLERPEDMRQVTKAHVIAWRDDLVARDLAGSSIRRKLSSLASLFDYLCDQNAMRHNPVHGVKRPRVDTNEGKTPALGDGQACALMEAPPQDTLKGVRDRAILATLLYHGIRREELIRLRVGDRETRQGVPCFKVHGKGDKTRFLPVHPQAAELIDIYLAWAGHGDVPEKALFRPVTNNSTAEGLDKPLSPAAINQLVRKYADQTGLSADISRLLGPHAMRATAATNSLDRGADLAKVQEMLGHADISTTRGYDRRNSRPADSPVLRVRYEKGAG